MKSCFTALLMAAASVGAAAQTLDPAKSAITAVSRQMNVPVEGKFTKFTGQITFDPAKPDAGKAELMIDTASFDIGNAEVNDEAKGKNWFDVKNFPQAKFVSTAVKAAGPGRFEVTGPLTIKGKTNTVIAPFTMKTEGGAAIYDGVFSIKRLAFNIGDGVWKDTDTVADDVQIRFRLVMAGGKTAPVSTKK
jgi:polyisoprenoid-binding protein YceI